jgi:hypothetical protein
MRKPVLAFLLVLLLSGAFPATAPTASASDVSVDISLFYNALAPYGQWVNRVSFGWVWVPHGVPVSWRPYTHGHWVYTDDYGWYWVSYWSWGWAPFHYGRWVYDDEYGWVWVPDTVWGPAWVDWRYGDGWIGWAPLPPLAVWRPGIGFSVRIVEIERHIHPTSWVFCHERNFRREHVYRYTELAARSVTLLPRTSNITRYLVEQDRIVNRGHDVDRLEKDTGQRVARYRVREVASEKEHRPTPRGNELPVYRPKVTPALPGARPPSSAPARVTAPPERIRQQQEIQRQQLLKQQQTERQKLQEHYRRQQQSEFRVLDEQHGREQKLLERRQLREYQMAPSKRQDDKSGERRRDGR